MFMRKNNALVQVRLMLEYVNLFIYCSLIGPNLICSMIDYQHTIHAFNDLS